MNVRQAIIAGLRRESILLPKVTRSLRNRAEDDSSALAALVQAADALEPLLAELVNKRPSKLSNFGLKSAHLLAGLAAEDLESNSRLAAIAQNSIVGIVFIDVAGFTTFTEEHGDPAAIELLGGLENVIDRSVKASKGEKVKALGDGYLLAFPSASQAVRGAVEIRDAVVKRRAVEPGWPVRLRLAVHAGEPSIEHDDLLGHDVNLTARLLDHSAPDEVVVSSAAKELAEKRLKKIDFKAPRSVKIRGLSTPVVIYSAQPVDGQQVVTRSNG
ncbi:MAG: adenylate/guanylate cyclase domain-containing protein [Actinobacteria bacterium]|nr:adenylate/guanylate cyclase domain-containing protein [Actinomycetota bacterium]